MGIIANPRQFVAKWHLLLLVMRPHPKHLDNMDIWQDLIHQPVLDVDSPRNRSFEVPDENFIWRRSLKRV